MGVKRSFKQILALVASQRTYIRSLSVVLTAIMALQLAVVPASAGLWPTESQKENESVASGEVTEGDGIDAAALESEAQPDVNTFAQYPQFMQSNDKEELSALV